MVWTHISFLFLQSSLVDVETTLPPQFSLPMIEQRPGTNTILLQDAMRILHQATQKLESHDYALAEVMVGVASQILIDARIDLEKTLHFERMVRQQLESN
jgi:hypothetical protein